MSGGEIGWQGSSLQVEFKNGPFTQPEQCFRIITMHFSPLALNNLILAFCTKGQFTSNDAVFYMACSVTFADAFKS